MNKLHLLTTKAGSRENIQWVLEVVDDAIMTKQCSPEDVSGRAIKGTNDSPSLALVLVARRQLRDQLFQLAQKEYASGWKPETLVQMQQSFSSVPILRKALKSLAWQRSFLPNQLKFVELLETILVTDQFDAGLRKRLKNREGVSDGIERMTELEEPLANIKELFDKEMQQAAEEEAARVAAEADTAEKENGCQPGADSSAGTGDPKVPKTDVEKEELTPEQEVASILFPKTPWEQVKPWVTQATRKIKRHCDLYVEPEDCWGYMFVSISQSE